MFDIIVQVLTLLGSIGLFLFGMKLMSEALQKVGGMRMRSILAAITANRYKSVFAGLTITGLIQTSSATTVMIVSFVSAGLLSVTESIGLTIGANIGTTVTSWLVALLGFKIHISTISIPLIGLSFPLLFSSQPKRKYWGEFFLGFAFIFLGLEYLKTTIPDISQYPQVLEFLGSFSNLGFVSYFIFILIGALVTTFIQSSSAAFALTMVMCYKGWIEFDLATAMILGENIGTTATANIAALVANRSGKVAARAHFVFNLMGLLWVIPLIKPFLMGIDKLVVLLDGTSPMVNVAAIPLGLAIFHTGFNVINALIWINFIPLITRISKKLVSKRNSPKKEMFRLRHIESGLVSTSELSILQAKKEISVYAHRVTKMFAMTRQLIVETNHKQFNKMHKRIINYESISDNMEVEIAAYLTRTSEGELSKKGSRRIRIMLKLVDEIESIADSCYTITISLVKKKEEKIWFTQDIRNNLNKMFDLLEIAFKEMNTNLNMEYQKVDKTYALELENRINSLRAQLRKEHLENIENNSYRYEAGVIYNDILEQCERMGDNIVNVSEAIVEPGI